MSSLYLDMFKKRAVSFLLVICMIFSVVSANFVFVSADSLHLGADSELPPYAGGDGPGAPVGWSGVPTTKVTIINCPDVLNTARISRGDFITIDNSAKSVAYVENATVGSVGANYNTTSKETCFWVGHSNVLANNDLYWAVPSGGAFKLNGMPNVYNNSSHANSALGLSGIDWHSTESINEYMWNEDNTEAIASLITKITGASGTTEQIINDHYIVIEFGFNFVANGIVVSIPPQAAFYNNANYVGGENKLESSLAGCHSKYASRIASSSVYAIATDGWSKCNTWDRTDDSKYAGWGNKEGYAVYIPAMLNPSVGTGALNVAVEYQGDPDTSDSTKFVADSSFVKRTGGTLNYYASDGTWKKFGNDAKKDLNITNISTSSEYSVIYADTYEGKLNAPYDVKTLLDKARDKAKEGYDLSWGSEAISVGVRNAGYAFTVNSLGGYNNTQAIVDKLQTISGFNITNRAETKITDASDLVNACHKNFKTAINAFSAVSADELGIKGLVSADNKITQNEKFGVGVEFIAKGKPVTSTKYTITVDMSTKTSTSAKTWSKDYSSADKNTVCPIEGGVACWVVVPNSSHTDSSTSTIGTAVANSGANSSDAVQNTVLASVTGEVIYGINSGIGVGLGCTLSTTEGYTVYEIIIKNSEPETGKLELPSFMLNRYFNEVMTFSSHIKTGSSLADSFWVTVWQDWTDYPDEDIASHWTEGTCMKSGDKLPIDYTTSYVIEYNDISTGTIIDWDKESLLGRYLLKCASPTTHIIWDKVERVNLKDKYQDIDTEDLITDAPSNDTKKYTIDYAFNLVRAGFGDKRSVSGIRYADYTTGFGDADDMLKLKDKFGVVPTVQDASSSRNPLATTGNVLTETISMQARFKDTQSSQYSHYASDATHECTEAGTCDCNLAGTCDCVLAEGEVCSIDHSLTCSTDHTIYCTLNDTTYKTFTYGAIQAFALRNIPSASTFTYSWDNIAYKYQTETLSTGKNNALGDNAMIPIDTHAKKPSEGKISDTNFYRFATVHNNNLTLNFYPEVKMATKIGGTAFDTEAYRTVYTMGEKLRTAESSMLYLFKLTGGTADITGTTYSDSAHGGTGSKFGSNAKVTIPAGSDVYITADPDSFSVDLFAYGLDIADKNYDTSINNGAGYSSIVASEADLRSAWSNGDNQSTLLLNFKNWCDAILNIKNYAADFKLEVDGTDKSANFGATVGNIKRNTTIDSSKSWNLVIENGMLDKTAVGYQGLIASIKADYGCGTTAEAEAIFEASGMYTAIINAIESSNDSVNKSGVAIPTDFDGNDTVSEQKIDGVASSDWTNQLGGSGNWYDEKTRTVVVRRFANTGNYIKDITAVDKIDYGLAPDSNASNKQNANRENVKIGKWYLNIFFNPDNSTTVNNSLLGEGGAYHNPNGTYGSTLSEANDSYTVLVNKAPVTDADFYISAESTLGF